MIYPDSFIAAGYEYADREHFVSAPFFRKKFTALKIKDAEILIGAAGFYRLFLNGKDITKGELAPYISNPDDIVYYDNYNVSDYINEGENVVTVLLGNGFQNNSGGAIWDFDKASWRGAPKFAMRLSMTTTDGSITEFESDENFKVCNSPILFDDYRCGEYYDARLEIPDFHLADFDDSSFKNAIKVKSPRGEKMLCTATPVRIYEELKPVSVTRQENGWLYDFGENNSGVCRLSVNLPYYTYLYRGDKEILEELSAPLMCYLKYLFSRLDEKGLMEIGLGDWCPPGVKEDEFETPLVVTDTILTYDIATKAAFVYEVLEQEPKKQFALTLAKKVKTAFRENLLDKQSGVVKGNTQTGQAMAIFYGLLNDEEKPKAFEVLLRYIDEADGHFNTGVLGGRVIYRVLAENGKVDLAYNMIVRPDYPSYGNWVKRGATTLWEGFYPENGRVLSLNHHFWGDVSAWFYTYLAGMRINPTGKDITNVDIKPFFPEKLDSVNAYHNLPDGRISASWERISKDKVVMKIAVAEKLHGKIILPSGYNFDDGSAEKMLASGEYTLIKS